MTFEQQMTIIALRARALVAAFDIAPDVEDGISIQASALSALREAVLRLETTDFTSN